MTTIEGRIRDDLRTIAYLAGLPLLAEAMRRGTGDSEAALLITPAADPETWRARRRDPAYVDHIGDRLGDQHPGWVLGQWDMLIREHLDQPTTLTVTVERAADYLGRQLTDLARDDEFPLGVMAEEIHTCRTHLEGVLREGEQIDRGAPCMSCNATLQRTWAGRDGEPRDGWRCPRCHLFSTDEQYRFAVQQHALEHAAELPAEQCAVRTGIKAGTVRVWAHRGLIGSRYAEGRVVYVVADVLRHAETVGAVAS